jgi:hypothetical protein
MVVGHVLALPLLMVTVAALPATLNGRHQGAAAPSALTALGSRTRTHSHAQVSCASQWEQGGVALNVE